ncbi:MAG: phosphopantetheine-binding protein [Bacteroidales bacterium]|nr:phosphopantetheine-binding protein [Bacteroidales bacterium]
MKQKELEDKIIEILKKYTFNDEVWNGFSTDMKIISDLKINSARIIDIVLDIEEEFDIEIPDKEIEKIITVRELIEAISSKVSN